MQQMMPGVTYQKYQDAKDIDALQVTLQAPSRCMQKL
jgi:hypothetical protein